MCSLTQLCPTLCGPVDCGPPGSFVHGIFQARIPDQVAISSFRRSPQPRAWTRVSCVSCIGRRVLCLCATWEAQHMCLNMVMCWWMVISVSVTGWFKIEKYFLQFLWKLRNLLNSMCHLKGRKLLLYTNHTPWNITQPLKRIHLNQF